MSDGSWITKRDAIRMVWRAQATRDETTGSAASASSTLGKWKRKGWVRTKPAPEFRRHYHKHDPVIFRRADIVKRLGLIGNHTSAKREDQKIAKLIAQCQRRKRRFELGIATLGRPHPPGETLRSAVAGPAVDRRIEP